MKALFLDDSATAHALYLPLLRSCGFEPLPAFDRAAALALARQAHPPLAIIDFYLKDGTGVEALGDLQADPATADMALVILTQDRSVIQTALAAGAIDVFFKDDPATILSLRLCAMRRFIEVQQQQRQAERLAYQQQLDLEAQQRELELARRAMATAQEADQLKQVFLTMINHELRTPLHVIEGMAELLAETPLAGEQQELLQILRGAGHDLDGLVDNLLTVSRAEAQAIQPQRTPFDLAELIREVTAPFLMEAQRKGVRFIWRLEQRPVGRVVGDPGLIKRVLVNLLANAVKFTQQGEMTLRVVRLAPPVQYRFTVQDTGIGIDPDDQARIFALFTQADGGLSRAFGGAGVGLTLCHHLTRLMGGELSLSSVPGKGSTFHLTLPLVEEVAEIHFAPTTRREPALSEPGPSNPEGLRLLLAEDSPDNVLLIQTYLKHTSHTLVCAENGQEAVAHFAAQPFDVVLMDIQMPVMDGYTATRQIRTLEQERGWPRTPVLAITAHAFPEAEAQSLAVGCDLFLTKPISKKRLLAILEQPPACLRATNLVSRAGRPTGPV